MEWIINESSGNTPNGKTENFINAKTKDENYSIRMMRDLNNNTPTFMFYKIKKELRSKDKWKEWGKYRIEEIFIDKFKCKKIETAIKKANEYIKSIEV